MDPFETTRQLIKEEFRPALPPVSKAWTVAAYTCAGAFHEDSSVERPQRLAALITHRFLTPADGDPNHELLRRAVELATTGEFRRKRARFYEWQEEIIEEDISDEKAIEELERRLKDYNESIQDVFKNVVARYAFTVIPIALTMAGASVASTTAGLLLAGAGGLVQLARFCKFDRKPVIESGDRDAAAMIHDARKRLALK